MWFKSLEVEVFFVFWFLLSFLSVFMHIPVCFSICVCQNVVVQFLLKKNNFWDLSVNARRCYNFLHLSDFDVHNALVSFGKCLLCIICQFKYCYLWFCEKKCWWEGIVWNLSVCRYKKCIITIKWLWKIIISSCLCFSVKNLDFWQF